MSALSSPSLPDVFKYACICRQSGKAKEAIAGFRSCLNMLADLSRACNNAYEWDKEWHCRYNLGSTLLEMGDHEGSREELEALMDRAGCKLLGWQKDCDQSNVYSACDDRYSIDFISSLINEGKPAPFVFEATRSIRSLPSPKPSIIKATLQSLATIHLKSSSPMTSTVCSVMSLTQSPIEPSDNYNLNTSLRLSDLHHQAISYTLANLPSLRPITTSNPYTLDSRVTVYCVKYGTKYGPEYVNKLASMISRHLPRREAFVCLTDDPAGLDPWVKIQGLEPGPPFGGGGNPAGWWHKALLDGVSPPGLCLYIDLDTVVTSSLEPLLSIPHGPHNFAALPTDTMANESRRGGLNTSIMLWRPSPELLSALSPCESDFRSVSRHLYKFDNYVEMLLPSASLIPVSYAREYKSCESDIDAGELPIIVTFPLKPKPHELIDRPWIQEHWR